MQCDYERTPDLFFLFWHIPRRKDILSQNSQTHYSHLSRRSGVFTPDSNTRDAPKGTLMYVGLKN